MKKKISKNALYVLAAGILVVVVIVMVFWLMNTKNDKEPKAKEPIIESLVVENKVLKVELLDLVSETSGNEDFSEQKIKVNKKDIIAGIKISDAQEFSKIMQLLPPDENGILLNNSSSKPSHNAYILILIGDIVKYVDTNGVETYKIVNAHIDYYKQSLLLENEYNSVYIASLDGTKEKMIKMTDYKAALQDVTRYQEVLQW